MRARPLIIRELLVQSRLSRTHWLRVAAALWLVLGTMSVVLSTRPMPRVFIVAGRVIGLGDHDGSLDRGNLALNLFEQRGGTLLAAMNLLILSAIWLVAPLLAADSLSRERRQGTLGFLFLTPLRATDVVLSKLFVHGLQVVSVLLAGLPLLMIPVLLGGVSWMDWLRAILLDFGALVLALAVGILASSLWRGPRAVLLGALGMSLGGVAVWILTWTTLRVASYPSYTGVHDSFTAFVDEMWRTLLWIGTIALHAVRNPAASIHLPGTSMVTSAAGLIRPAVLCSAGFLLGIAAVLIAIWRVRLALREGLADWETVRPESSRSSNWRFHWRAIQIHLRSRLPMLWLEMRTWRGHVIPWLSLFAVFPMSAWRMMNLQWIDVPRLGAPGWLLVGVVALAASSCLQAERTSGALHLLAHLPNGEWRLIAGKLAGVTFQCLPASLLMVVLEAARSSDPWANSINWSAAVALSLAVVGTLALTTTSGMLLGLIHRNLALAWGLTLVLVVVCDRVTGWLGQLILAEAAGPMSLMALAGVLQLMLALGFAAGLHRFLSTRLWTRHGAIAP